MSMKLKDIYSRAVQYGLKNDPRSTGSLRKIMNERKKAYRALRGANRKFFDAENLKHPFSDTRILYGAPETEVRSIMVGIDVGIGELLVGDRLNQRGEGIDLAMSHHPSGLALAGLANVMGVHLDILENLGLSREIGKNLVQERVAEVDRKLHAGNHTRNVDAARLLDIPYMCVHTPSDNCVVKYLDRLFTRKRPKTVGDIVSLLDEIPEYNDATKQNAGPRTLVGKRKDAAGKVFVDMTGGTEGPKRVFARLSQAGVGTIVAMHLSEEHFKSAKSERINVVVAGHIASDNLGVNLLLDTVTRGKGIKIVPCSGFIRVER
ncbi:MAG: NGG1p interacting factor NIF3 [Candidatus Omnitrophota bacterium]